jgi:multicomponent Na+:H+ antiporter subunit E
MTAVRTRLPFLGWLVGVWVALWGDLSAANVLSGLVVGAALITAFPHAGPGPTGVFRPWRALQFVGYFLYKLVESNFLVAWEVITPNNEGINEAIVAVPITGASDAVVTLVANAISLTPGTLTLEVRREPATLYVHVLHLRTIQEVRAQVQTLEYLALRAFCRDQTVVDAVLHRSEQEVATATRRVTPRSEQGGPEEDR